MSVVFTPDPTSQSRMVVVDPKLVLGNPTLVIQDARGTRTVHVATPQE